MQHPIEQLWQRIATDGPKAPRGALKTGWVMRTQAPAVVVSAQNMPTTFEEAQRTAHQGNLVAAANVLQGCCQISSRSKDYELASAATSLRAYRYPLY